MFFLYFPIFPFILNSYFSLFYHDFWPKIPIFPYIFSISAPLVRYLRGFACEGAYKRPQALTIVKCVLSLFVLQQAAHIWRGTHDHFGTKVLLHNQKEYVFWSRKMVDDILGNLYKKFYRRLKLDISSA